MDIQAEKIELAKLISKTNDLEIIKQIKNLFKVKMKIGWTNYPYMYSRV